MQGKFSSKYQAVIQGQEDRFQKLLAHRKVQQKEIPARIEVELSASALIRNYQAIQALAPNQLLLPMVKANAYGHGVAWVSRLLEKLPGLYGFGVATLGEGAQLRKILSARNPSKESLKGNLKKSLKS